jgi:siderophore synthetase component
MNVPTDASKRFVASNSVASVDIQVSGSEVRGAEAAVLARLWGALTREPIPGIGRRHQVGGVTRVQLDDGRWLHGPAAAGAPHAKVVADLAVFVGEERIVRAADLLRELRLPVPLERITRLASELENSAANLASARAVSNMSPHRGGVLSWVSARRAADPGFDSSAYLEQTAVDGHPTHPCCRSRSGFSASEVRAYAPEHRPIVDLVVVEVPTPRWHAVGEWPRHLRADDRILVPMHPWQVARLDLTDYGLHARALGIPARPLMSLRTLAPIGGGLHIKTALATQLTSAIRNIATENVHNGPPLSRWLSGLDLPGLTVLAEPAAGALRSDAGLSADIAVLLRQPPRTEPGELTIPVGALAAVDPRTGMPVLAEALALGYAGNPTAAAQFITTVAALAARSIGVVLARYGIALEAHGQNLLVVLRDGRPVRLVYRDLGGIRVDTAVAARNGAPRTQGSVRSCDPDETRATLLSAFVSGALGTLVTACGDCGFAPDRLWAAAADVLRNTWPVGPGHDALFADRLPVKATTAMRLAEDPDEFLWCSIRNPLADT